VRRRPEWSVASQALHSATGAGRYSTLTRREYRTDVVRQHVRPPPVGLEDAQAPLRVEDVRSCRMIHRVAARRGTWLLLIENLEFLRGRGRRIGVGVQAEECRSERR